MSTNPIKLYSVREYFEIEKDSDIKHEFVYGEIFAMSGASERHCTIANNINVRLWLQLLGSTCRCYISDMRTRINEPLYHYPDVVIGCEPRFEIIEGLQTLINPIFVAEVLSPSTARFDREAKFREYQQIDSLRYYLLVSQNEVNATLFTRQNNHNWTSTNYAHLENIIELPLINSRLLISNIYLNTGF